MQTTVSVIIPYYNGSKFITATLDSVLSQTVAPFEILLINVGSTPKETKFLEGLDQRVTVINQKNTGVSTARNTAISKAKGEWIALLDHDDHWEKNKLEKQLAYIDKNPQCKAIHTAVKTIKKDGTNKLYFKKTLTLIDFLCGHPNPSYLSSTMIKKDAFIAAGLFNSTLDYSQDLECFLRCARFFNFDYIDEALTIRFEHESNLSGNYMGVWQENIAIARFYRNEFQDKSLYHSKIYYLHFEYALKSLQNRNWHGFFKILSNLPCDKINRFQFLISLFLKKLPKLSIFK